jgi:hypothetical protein
VLNRAGFRKREERSRDAKTGRTVYGPWEWYVLPEVWRKEGV